MPILLLLFLSILLITEATGIKAAGDLYAILTQLREKQRPESAWLPISPVPQNLRLG